MDKDKARELLKLAAAHYPLSQPAGSVSLNETQRAEMARCQMAEPLPLAQAKLDQPFVYSRQYGVFYVPARYHQIAMTLLLAFQQGLASGEDVAAAMKLPYPDGTADRWLEETPGTAFKSSVGSRIQVGHIRKLSLEERRYFVGAQSVFD